MSISKSQAAALAEGFFDDIGEDISVLQPKETYSELFLLAGELVDLMQLNLNQDTSNASGSLSSSIQLGEPVQEGGVIRVDLFMNFYGLFVNDGVKGTQSGEGKYQFKNAYPNKKMALALLKGIRKARNKTRKADESKSKSKYEKKNFKTAKLDGKAAAYGAAVNIKKFGIKPTGFLNKAAEVISKKMEERLGAALSIDVFNMLPDKL